MTPRREEPTSSAASPDRALERRKATAGADAHPRVELRPGLHLHPGSVHLSGDARCAQHGQQAAHSHSAVHAARDGQRRGVDVPVHCAALADLEHVFGVDAPLERAVDPHAPVKRQRPEYRAPLPSSAASGVSGGVPRATSAAGAEQPDRPVQLRSVVVVDHDPAGPALLRIEGDARPERAGERVTQALQRARLGRRGRGLCRRLP